MALKLKLHTQPDIPLEADCISSDRLQSLNESEITALTLFHGNRQVCLGDFFSCAGKFEGEVIVEGDLNNIKHIGSVMSFGKLILDGDVGVHTGAEISGGEIIIEGNTNGWFAPEMPGGKITVKGNAGHMVDSGYRGSTVGMQGGEIIVHGNVKNETGRVIKCGSIICQHRADILPTFSRSCDYQLPFLRHYFKYLKSIGLSISDSLLNEPFECWCGDSVELNWGRDFFIHGRITHNITRGIAERPRRKR